MTLSNLQSIPNQGNEPKLQKAFIQFEKVLTEIQKKDLPERVTLPVNKHIDEINITISQGIVSKKLIRKAQSNILKLLEKELKIVPKNYYRNLWMALGMASFGIPIGVAMGTALDNLGLMAIGLPIGLAVGVGVGSGMDKKALDEGRQLDVEIDY